MSAVCWMYVSVDSIFTFFFVLILFYFCFFFVTSVWGIRIKRDFAPGILNISFSSRWLQAKRLRFNYRQGQGYFNWLSYGNIVWGALSLLYCSYSELSSVWLHSPSCSGCASWALLLLYFCEQRITCKFVCVWKVCRMWSLSHCRQFCNKILTKWRVCVLTF